MAAREKEMRRREEKLGNWTKDKAARRAAVRQLKNKLKNGPSSDTQSTLSRSSSTASEWTRDIKDNQTEKKTTAGDLKQEDEEGYTNLQATPGEGSMDDLR